MNTSPSIFDAHAEAFRSTYATPKTPLKDGSAVAEQNLNAHGYAAPDMYAGRSVDDNGELLAN